MNDRSGDRDTAEALARQFLELWQEQFNALATDPQMAEAMARMFQTMAVPGAATGGLGGAPHDRAGKPDEKPRGAAAAAAAPDDLRRDLDELRRRVAALEKRLDGLASGSEGGG